MMNKKMIELNTPDERLEMLLEAARTTGYKELERAIIGYWFDEGYREAKEKRNEQIEKII